MDKRTLGKRLKRLRQIHGLTQESVARRMDFKSISTVAKTESGARTVSASELLRWCALFETTAEDLASGKAITVTVPGAVTEAAS